jgi:hypothetical protein
VAVSQLYLALESVRKRSNHNFFTTGGGSFEENLNFIYNASKHELAGTELPVWFTDDGLACSQAKVSFIDIEAFMRNMAGVVKGLCNREIALQALQS